MTSIQRAQLISWPPRQLELLANLIFETSIPTINLFSVLCKDSDNLYKWLMFQPKRLPQSQILYADNNITTIRDIISVCIDINESICSVINYGHGFVQLER